MKAIRHFRELNVYQNAMDQSLKIFQVSTEFPKEETYSLTDQIRRSSRSVCANIAEAWRKRRYPAAFISKLSDSEAEAAETQVWLEQCLRLNYISKKQFEDLDKRYEEILGQLVKMINAPEKWAIHSTRDSRE